METRVICLFIIKMSPFREQKIGHSCASHLVWHNLGTSSSPSFPKLPQTQNVFAAECSFLSEREPEKPSRPPKPSSRHITMGLSSNELASSPSKLRAIPRKVAYPLFSLFQSSIILLHRCPPNSPCWIIHQLADSAKLAWKPNALSKSEKPPLGLDRYLRAFTLPLAFWGRDVRFQYVL